jgi:hypothetical protein
MRPDGETLTLFFYYFHARLTPAFELIKEYLEDVGLEIVIKMEGSALMNERRLNLDMSGWMHAAIWYPWSDERQAFMNVWVWSDEEGHAPPWYLWLPAKEAAAKKMLEEGEELPANWRWLETPEDDELPGERPPDWWLEQADLEDRWMATDMGTAEYRRLGQEVYDFYVENVIKIGTVGEIPNVLIVKKGLGNVPPPGYVEGLDLGDRLIHAYRDQFYWK